MKITDAVFKKCLKKIILVKKKNPPKLNSTLLLLLLFSVQMKQGAYQMIAALETRRQMKDSPAQRSRGKA